MYCTIQLTPITSQEGSHYKILLSKYDNIQTKYEYRLYTPTKAQRLIFLTSHHGIFRTMFTDRRRTHIP